MNRFWLLPLVLAMPLAAGAQAIRCTDPATGKVLYTDQPCRGGTLVAPPRSEAERRHDAQADQLAREREALRQDQAALREQQRRDALQSQAAANAAAAAAAAAANPASSAECRAAREEADFRARSVSATPEQIRTARYNAALACGQQPPAEIVNPTPVWNEPGYPYPYGQPHVRRPPPAWRPPPPPRPTYEQGSEPIPVRVTPPSAR